MIAPLREPEHEREDDRAASYLDTTSVERLAPFAPYLFPAANAGEPLTGRVVGAFTVRERIGEGGRSVVYRAEQENPRRSVALKVLHAGAPSPEDFARSAREAELLGTLDHPGVARIIEAGTVDSGAGAAPFLAMEYVDGVPITEYARRLELDPRSCVKLFLELCGAIEHAHQRGVIHLDLKPTNVLVDDNGLPRVIDFGLARASDGQSSVAHAGVAGTLAYMSPEQASGDMAQVDMQTDVYALGAILYELLTGETPHAVAGLPLGNALEKIRSDEIRALADLRRECRGDLSTIVHTALAPEKGRRYATVSGLAADLRHFLNDEPIAARPATTVYLLGKYARRHKSLIGAISIAGAALVAGSVLAVWQAAVAHKESRKATGVHSCLVDMLTLPPASTREPGEVRVIDILDRAHAGIARAEANDDPELAYALKETLAGTYFSLGLYDEARPLCQEIYATRLRERGERDPDTLRAMVNLVMIGSDGHERSDVVIELGRRAVALCEETLGANDPLTLHAKHQLARILVFTKDRPEAVRFMEEACAGYAASDSDDDKRSHVITLLDLAETLNEPERREALYKQAFARMEGTLGDDNRIALRVYLDYGYFLTEMKRYDEAEPLIRRVIAYHARCPGKETIDTLRAYRTFAMLLSGTGRTEEAIEQYRAVLGLIERFYGDAPLISAEVRCRIGSCLIVAGRLDEAETELLAAYGAQSAAGGKSLRLEGTLRLLVHLYGLEGRPDEKARFEAELAQEIERGKKRAPSFIGPN